MMKFTEIELFLIEMALDEVLWKLTPGSPAYQRYDLLNQKINSLRKQMKVEVRGDDTGRVN